MVEKKITMNANANIAKAAYIRGNTSLILALVMEGIRIPVRMITEVPANELNEPPSWISWLPLFPPPPRELSIGFTTVLSKHMEKPAMNAPNK